MRKKFCHWRSTTCWMRMVLVCAALWSCASHTGAAAQGLRIVSANLCADQLVMALADPAQIISLGPFARDKALSFLHEKAQRYPANRGSAEEMIGLKAELVLMGSFDSRYARAVLEKQRISVMTLEPWTNIAQGRQQIRAVAERLGHAAPGEALIARIDAGVETLVNLARARTKPASALVLHRRGYAMHSGVAAELLQIAGISNAAGALGLAGSGLVALEKIIASPPDFLVVSRDVQSPTDQGEALLAHPALERIFPPHKRLVIPDQLAICAGPSTPALVEMLGAEIARKTQ